MRRSLNLTTIIVLYGQTPNLDTPPAPTGRATPRCPSPLGYSCTRPGAYTNGLQLSILVYFNPTVTGISKGCQATLPRAQETLTKCQRFSTLPPASLVSTAPLALCQHASGLAGPRFQHVSKGVHTRRLKC